MKNITYIFLLSTMLLFSQNRAYIYTNYKNIDSSLKKNQNRFYIQIGAFTNKRYALVVEKSLKRLSYHTVIIRKRVEITNYYKVLIGTYSNREEATRVKSRLPKNYSEAFIVWNRGEL